MLDLEIRRRSIDRMLRTATFDASTWPRRRRATLLPVVAAVLAQIVMVVVVIGSPGAVAAQRGDPLDIVLVITDDQRAGTLTHMPRLRRRIAARGVRFRSAFIPNPSCCPSRASFLTGTYSHTNGVWKNGGAFGGFAAFDPSSTIATWLDDAGYRTGLFGKYLNGYTDASIVPPGWDEWFGFMSGDGRSYYGFTASVNGELVDFADDEYSTTVTSAEVSRFIRSTPADRPLFVLWTPVAPHSPAVPEAAYVDASLGLEPWRPPNFNERDVSDKSSWLRRTGRLDASQRLAIDARRLDQYRTLLSVDDGIADIVKSLRQSGRLSNTLVVFASDNGVMWGEHRLIRKAAPFDGASHVPMLVRYYPLTAQRRGGASRSLVLNLDVAPTIAELVGLVPPTGVDGRSPVPLLDGSAVHVRKRFVVEHADGGVPAYCGARTRDELFVHYVGGDEEYYRLDDDPYSLENLIDDREWRREIEALRRYARRHCDPVPPGFFW